MLRIHAAPEPPPSAPADFDLVHFRQRQETLRERWSLTLRFTFLALIPSELVVYNPMGIRPGPGDGSAPVIAHLGGREDALEPLGWTGRQAEWIALACLHSGVFTRAQLSAYLRVDRWQALRFVRTLLERGLAAEDTLEQRKVCRIFGRGIYCALDAEDIRHRRDASEEVLIRRLLSLDYVLEHPGLPWLPTEPEKVGAFEALGIERRVLPIRVYRGAAGNTRRHFPLKLPVSLEAECTVFVYVDPGYETAKALHSWGAAHHGLWKALRKRCRSVVVVAVVRTVRELQRAQTILENWVGARTSDSSGPSESPQTVRREIARIEQAILEGDDRALEEYGDLQAGLERIVELKELQRISRSRAAIDCFATWRSSRLPGGWS